MLCFSTFLCSQSDDHAQEDLVKYGYELLLCVNDFYVQNASAKSLEAFSPSVKHDECKRNLKRKTT